MLTRPSPRSARRIGCSASALALATALATGPAFGQTAPLAYNAPDPTVASGSVNFSRGVTPNVETYTITSPTAVLDFTPSDTTGTGTINFQNAGSTVTYQGGSNFTVLNRIVPTNPARAIQFNGTVNSRIGVTAPVAGGSVWFYSPGGIVLGAGAAFDVGSLLLATGDPTGGSGTIGSVSNFTISSAANSNAAITIQPGAQINATPEGSYVALVAPVVRQGGAVRVNGSAAYVAAEAATLAISQGLFDISVSVGSDNVDGIPLTHTGTTGGPSSTGAGDNHGIFMVAVPKNTAITMLIAPNGQLGFDAAASATVENGAIYLQAGDDLRVTPGTSVEERIQSLPESALGASIDLTGGTFSSALIAQATTSTLLRTGSAPMVLQGATYLYGGKEAQLGILANGSLTAQDRVIVNSIGPVPGQAIVYTQSGANADFQSSLDIYASPYPGRSFPLGFDVDTGGAARLDAFAGTVKVAALKIDSGGVSSGPAGAAGGGTQLLAQQGGSVTVAGDVVLGASASAFGNIVGTGGTASLIAADGGSISIGGAFEARAEGIGSDGANAVGGTAQIFTNAGGGSISIAGASTLSADGIAFSGTAGVGSGKGGTASFDLLTTSAGKTTTVNVADLNLSAVGVGGTVLTSSSQAGGAATGGTVRVGASQGVTVNISGGAIFEANATGGSGSSGGGNGGAATGGTGQFFAQGGSITAQSLTFDVIALGGTGGSGATPTAPSGSGGAAVAGSGVSINAANGGSIIGKAADLRTSAFGGQGGSGASGSGLAGSGGAANGSAIAINALGGGQVKLASVTADTGAIGGATGLGTGQSGTTGGAAQGGALTIGAGVGLIEFADLNAGLDAFGGDARATGADGGDAKGGAASVFAQTGSTVRVTTGGLFVGTTAAGGESSGGGDLIAGSATGGDINVSGTGTLDFAGTNLRLDSSAFAGDFLATAAGGSGGKAAAGAINLGTSGTLNVAGVSNLFAVAVGGDTASLSGGAGGNAFGGKAFINASKGAAAFTDSLTMEAGATGGSADGTSAGGAGVGGRARISTDAFNTSSAGTGPSTISIAGTVFMNTDGRGGGSDNGTGGAGYGGQAPITGLTTIDGGIEIHTLGGAITLNQAVTQSSRGTGGDGGTGGLGKGGRANVIAFGGTITSQQSVFGVVDGFGGFASAGAGAEGAAGTFAVQTQDGGFGVPAGTVASITLGGVTGSATGRGGTGPAGGGIGRGGSAFIQALAAQNSITVTDVTSLSVIGIGGNSSGSGPEAGGAGIGGSTSVSGKSGTLIFNQSVDLSADAFGGSAGSGGSGNGGAATGGVAFYFADAGDVVQTGGSIDLSSRAFGGAAGLSGTGGGGTGGRTNVDAFNGGTIDSSATFVRLEVNGEGGSVSGSGNGTGGIGQGGNARILASADGTIGLRSVVDISAPGQGGAAAGTGNGGTGIGGEARISTAGGQATNKVAITGDASLDASGFGGSAENGRGGDGLGGTPANVDTGPFTKGAYLVATGGEITIDGVLEMDATGAGGFAKTGGNGTGGLVNLVAFGARIAAPNLVSFSAAGSGGSGDSGGRGGDATGGLVTASASSGGDSQGGGTVPLGSPSTVIFGDIFVDASAEGGEGGDGEIGLAGGIGGNATGGTVRLLAQAGSGQLVTSGVTAFLQGVGGSGGTGGAAASPTSSGGAGGSGGAGTGGFTNFGTASGPATTNNDGTATFDDVTFFLNGLGGAGGDGVDGGNGGAGGLGQGGNGALLSRGAPIVATSISIDGSGFGGEGGAGSGASPLAGAVGEGRGGSAGMLITNRFNRTERGSLNADTINFTASGLGGFDGANFGPSQAGQVFAQVSKSDATIVSGSLFASGNTPPPVGSESYIKVDNGVFQAANLTVGVTGDLLLAVVDNGVLRAGDLSLNVSGALLPPTTGTPGTIDATQSFSGFFEGDFVTTANFSTTGSFILSAGGALQTGSITSGRDIELSSSGSISVGDLSAADGVRLLSDGAITTGDIVAGLGNSSSVFGDVEIATFGSVQTGNIKAATIDFQVGDPSTGTGSAQTLGLLAESITLDVVGDLVTGDVTTNNVWSGIETFDDYLIGIGAGGNISLANVDAFTSVGIGSVGGKLEIGTIRANDSVLLLSATSISTGGITTGTDADDSVFLSNTSIIETNPDFAVLQDFDELGESFDIGVLRTAAPVRTAGFIDLSGPVATTNFAAATAQTFRSGAISAPGRLFLDVGGTITGGALSTGGSLTLSSDQDITLGDLTAADVTLTSLQNVTAGRISASGLVNITAVRFAVFNGQVTGSTIDVTSGDIAIGQGGGLGGPATSRLTLTATGGSPRFGGTIGDTQYSLSAAEAQGLRAQLIELRSNSSVLLGEMTLNGSLAGDSANLIGANGRLTVTAAAGNSFRVVGPVTIANAAPTNRLTLSGDTIEVSTTEGGSLGLFGASSSALGGTLAFNAAAVRVASPTLLDQLPGMTAAQRTDALRAAPNGPARPEGYLQANRIEFITNQLFIQNSNTATQFGGFSAGPGGAVLASRSGGQTPVDAIIHGRIADTTGAFRINGDAVSLLTIGSGEGGPTTLTATSSFNGCPFTGSCAIDEPPPAPRPEEEEEVEVVIDRIPNVIAAAIEGAMASTTDPESVAALPTVNLITTIDTGPLRTEPVISDPVTGGGNPSLWEGSSDQDEREDERPARGGDGQ
jgi:filamentous hemagglutinin family protein